MLIYVYPHQDPGSTVLNVLELLEAPTREPDEEYSLACTRFSESQMEREGRSLAMFPRWRNAILER